MLTTIQLSYHQRSPYAFRAFNLYESTYKSIGQQFNSPIELYNESHVWDLTLDGKRLIAVMFYKQTTFGLKSIAICSVNDMNGKLAAVNLMRNMGQPRRYGELSDAPAAIAQKLGLPKVHVTEVKNVLNNVDINPIDDYTYSRRISILNIVKQKIMFGKPVQVK